MSTETDAEVWSWRCVPRTAAERVRQEPPGTRGVVARRPAGDDESGVLARRRAGQDGPILGFPCVRDLPAFAVRLGSCTTPQRFVHRSDHQRAVSDG